MFSLICPFRAKKRTVIKNNYITKSNQKFSNRGKGKKFGWKYNQDRTRKQLKKERSFGEMVAWEKWVDSYSGRREKKLEVLYNLMDTVWLCMSQLVSFYLLRLPQVSWEVWASGLKISLDILFSEFPEETQMVTLPACQIENLHCSLLMTFRQCPRQFKGVRNYFHFVRK